MIQKTTGKTAIDFLFFALGGTSYALAINVFLAPNNILLGGFTGVATILNYLFHTPIGTVVFLFNIPLFIAAFRKFGLQFILKTVFATFLVSVLIDVTAPFLPVYSGDRLLCALFGGILSGAGLGLVFLRGATTGGTDIISCLTERRFPHIQIGKALMLIDGVVLAASVVVFKNIESGMFGIVALFCQTRIIDGIVYGVDKGKNILIVSEKNKRIAELILERMERGATFLKAEGAYFGKDMKVLMCVVRAPEYHVLREIVYNEDPRAFIIVSDVSQIMGEGFAPVKLSKMG